MNYMMLVSHQDYEGFKDDELEVLERRSGWGSLYTSDPQVLCMDSSDPQNPPGYIGRQSCEPLTTQQFFSLRQNWQQLLDGKKTYLRPPKNNRVAKDNYANCLLVTPEPLQKAIQCQGLEISGFGCSPLPASVLAPPPVPSPLGTPVRWDQHYVKKGNHRRAIA